MYVCMYTAETVTIIKKEQIELRTMRRRVKRTVSGAIKISYTQIKE